jgi:hypothetical protein
MSDAKDYTVFVKIIRHTSAKYNAIAQASVVRQGFTFEAHGTGKTLEEAEDKAINRALALAGLL